MQEIDNEWYTFISNEKQSDTKTFEFQVELQEEKKFSNKSEYEMYENDEHNGAEINADDSLRKMIEKWNAQDKKSVPFYVIKQPINCFSIFY